MRVLMLSAAYPPGEGGVATHVASLVHGLAHRSVDITVLTLGRDRPTAPGSPDASVQVAATKQGQIKVEREGFDRINILKQRHHTIPLYDGRRVYGEEILELLRNSWQRIRADVIHCHDLDSLFIGWMIKTLYELPLVFTLHRAPNPYRTDRYKEDVKDLFLESVKRANVLDAVVVPSEASAIEARKQFGKDRGAVEVKVIWHGISRTQLPSFQLDDKLIADLGLWQERKVIFCPCRADENKDVNAFLDAAAILRRGEHGETLFFVIASGPGDDLYEHAVQRAKHNGLTENNCHFQKFNFQQMATIYRHAHVCVVPSRHESFGQVILEAWLMKVPVVAANTTALTEIVTHGQTGLHFTDGKSKELAQQVACLLDDEALKERLIRNARNLLEKDERFSVERMCWQHEQLYAKLFSKDGP